MKKNSKIDLQERLREMPDLVVKSTDVVNTINFNATRGGWKFNGPEIKFVKMSDDVQSPTKAHDNDMGWDIYGTHMAYDYELGCYVMHTGLKVEVPDGWGLLIFPRSSINKKSLMLSNSVGVVDAGYRGEILFYFRPTYNPAITAMQYTNFSLHMDVWDKMKRRERKKYNNSFFTYLSSRGFFDLVGELHTDMMDEPNIYHPGDRIGQAVLVPNWVTKFVETEKLSDSERGSGGFGSTGK